MKKLGPFGISTWRVEPRRRWSFKITPVHPELPSMGNYWTLTFGHRYICAVRLAADRPREEQS